MSQFISPEQAADMLAVDWVELLQLTAPWGPIPVLDSGAGKMYEKQQVVDYLEGRLKGAVPLSTESIHDTFESEFFSEAIVSDVSGLVRNVLLCGNKSRNGYDLPERCFGGHANTKRLYENKPVFIDHAPKGKELSRSVKDMAGIIQGVQLRAGRPYGDIDTEAYPCGPELLKIARARPRGVGMSHVAIYRFSSDRYTVEEIQSVESVDVVFRPATTDTFFEKSGSHGQGRLTTADVFTQPPGAALSSGCGS